MIGVRLDLDFFGKFHVFFEKIKEQQTTIFLEPYVLVA